MRRFGMYIVVLTLQREIFTERIMFLICCSDNDRRKSVLFMPFSLLYYFLLSYLCVAYLQI